MKYIAHRGNLSGPKADYENKPSYIDRAISEGFDVEVDVWLIHENLFLGHDQADTQIDALFLFERMDKLWCHAKNLEALVFLVKQGFNCFYHDRDDYVLTSKNIIWAYPGQKVDKHTVCVMPERTPQQYTDVDIMDCYGICTDYVYEYALKTKNLKV